MNKPLPLELVVARIQNLSRALAPDVATLYSTRFAVTEDLEAALEHVATTSGFSSTTSMIRELNRALGL